MKLRDVNLKIWLPVILALAYLLTRLINLTVLPIFVDEAIYTRWAQIILADPGNNFFIPLSDGKQPLFMWLAAIFVKFFSDPLVATRLTSVLAGGFGVWGSYLLAKEFFGRRIGILCAILFILCPFLMFYNRLAVVDGMLTTFFIFTVYLAYILAKKPTIKNSVILGLILGLGVLTKSTAAIGILFIPFSLVFFGFNDRKRNENFAKLAGLWVLSALIGFVMYRVLKLSPLYYLINQRTPDFIYTPKEVLSHLFNPFIPRIGDVAGWLVGYFTLPIFVAIFGGLIWVLKKDWRKGVYLGAYFLGPLLIEMEIAKGFTPRYFIYIAPIALILASYFLDYFSEVVSGLVRDKDLRIWVGAGVITILLIPAFLFEVLLLSNPEKAPIPEKEKTGYLEEWSAGYGIYEISQYLRDQARSGQAITVGTEGIQGYGTLPDGLEVYLRGVKNVSVVGMGQRADIYNVPTDLIRDSAVHRAYLVVNDNRMFDKQNKVLNLVAKYPKGNGLDPLLLYQIKND